MATLCSNLIFQQIIRVTQQSNFVTNNGTTRFHPNYYTSGKVCLSLLNTWRGEEWSSCNTISSILLHMASIFTDKALLHEPGIREDNVYVKSYDIGISYQTMKTAILDVYLNRYTDKYLSIPKMFCKEIEETFKLNKKNISELLDKRFSKNPKSLIYTSFYQGTETVDYETLKTKFEIIFR